MSRFSRPNNGSIPWLPPYTPEVAQAAEYYQNPRIIPGCPARGIRDVTEPYSQCIEQTGPVSIIGRNNEKVSGG